MVSVRSKAIWDCSTPLGQYVAQRVANNVAKSPCVTTTFRWQLAEYLWKFADGYFGQDKVPEHVRSAIARGELIATGWRETPSRSAGPVIIPQIQFLHGEFRLLPGRIDSGRHRYRDVRITEKANLFAGLLINCPNQQSRHAQIAQVIRDLSIAGELREKLRKQQIPIVRAALENAGIKNVGTDKTIERLIRRHSISE